jgi:hypothetical protein
MRFSIAALLIAFSVVCIAQTPTGIVEPPEPTGKLDPIGIVEPTPTGGGGTEPTNEAPIVAEPTEPDGEGGTEPNGEGGTKASGDEPPVYGTGPKGKSLKPFDPSDVRPPGL